MSSSSSVPVAVGDKVMVVGFVRTWPTSTYVNALFTPCYRIGTGTPTAFGVTTPLLYEATSPYGQVASVQGIAVFAAAATYQFGVCGRLNGAVPNVSTAYASASAIRFN